MFVLAFALEREGGPDPMLGVVALAIAVGSFAGTFVSPRLRAVTNEHTMLRAGTVVGAVTALIAAVAADMRTVVLATFMLALASSVGRHACDSVLQRAAGKGDRSRVFARCDTALQLAWVAGALVPTVAVVDVRFGFAIATCLLGAGALAIGWPRVTVRRPIELTPRPAPLSIDAAA